jgi:hypothetical protein
MSVQPQRRGASSRNNVGFGSSGLSSAAPGVSVRRFLSENGEKEVMRALKEQLRRQQRVTSDDVRMAVRAVASQEGAATLPPDFPPSRWVLEFKRLHGFVQFNSFAFGAAVSGGGKNSLGSVPERLEAASLRRDNRHDNNIANDRAAQAAGSSLSSGNNSDDEKEKEPSAAAGSISPETRRMGMYSARSACALPAPPGALHPSGEGQRQTQLQRSFSQYHRQFLLQQQRRAMLVDDHRRVAPRTVQDAAGEVARGQGGVRSSPNGGAASSRPGRTSMTSGGSSLPSHVRYSTSRTGSSVDDIQDSASNASSFTATPNDSSDKRGYRLSHTVPAETWEKAIAAVEHQGMSLRSAAKMYGVHFAALHRRVKKRAQGGLGKSNNGYFHQSDEAGIMRVVVARAELGVLMTFEELMRLVEAAALCKLPDLSVDSARKLLTRFQSRNEQSIRHLIDDWPLPLARPLEKASPPPRDGPVHCHQPYLGHPGFSLGTRPGIPDGIAAALAAATSATHFVPPRRLASSTASSGTGARKPAGRLIDTMRAMELGTTPSISSSSYAATHSNVGRPCPPQGLCVDEIW